MVATLFMSRITSKRAVAQSFRIITFLLFRFPCGIILDFILIFPSSSFLNLYTKWDSIMLEFLHSSISDT